MLFSIVVPIYKIEKYLERCVESILNQTFDDFEIILVDDGSPDKCPEICDRYASIDSRVKVIHKKNGGLVSARNAGIMASQGRYLCYVDGDDWVSHELLKTVYDHAIKHDPDMIIYNAVRVFDDRQVPLPKGLDEGIYGKEELVEKVYPYMLYDNRQPFCHEFIFPVAWNKIYKRELLLNHYCKDERIAMGEDSAFVFECIYNSDKVYFCDAVLYYYNQMNQGSFIHRYDSKRFINNKYLAEYVERNLGGKSEMVDTQINAFKAYWLIMAIFQEVKTKQRFFEAVKHIREGIEGTGILNMIDFSWLPRSAQAYLMLLKYRMYHMAIIGAKVINSQRG